MMDRKGPFKNRKYPSGWGDATSQYLWDKIQPKMKHLELTTFEKLGKKRAHSGLCTDLIKKATDRLEELELDDYGKLFSLRLAGQERIFGIRERNILKILWCDPKHGICPSLK